MLSNGHGSALLYALLHLSGYSVSVDALKAFRQHESITPGHPEYGLTPGVETTTGPLGQGLATAVGMALAEAVMAKRFNRPSYPLFDHRTFVFAGDGCLMEGISHEACSLAGHWGLNKLVVFYDDNGISIDGRVTGWFSEDTKARFESYNWHVIPDVDGHDMKQITKAIDEALESTQPSVICCKTVIGCGAPNKQGLAETHGSPLGEEEVAATRKLLNYPFDAFCVPEHLREAWDMRQEGKHLSAHWNTLLSGYAKEHAQHHAELKRRLDNRLPEDYTQLCEEWIGTCRRDKKTQATRRSSKDCLEFFAPKLPELIGGSADLSDSNNTLWSGCSSLAKDDMGGNYLHYGAREFAMSAIGNGMALHGGLSPYMGTFLVFSDYARNAVRLAAMMGVPCIFIYSHDSLGLGEDGPTHQPIEQLPSLRMIPGLNVWRPADLVETAVAWAHMLATRDTPAALVLSRQSTPPLPYTDEHMAQIQKGGYVLLEPKAPPQVMMIATGSEVAPALEAAQGLGEEGVAVRVVSLPCVEVFEAQSQEYRESVLPPALRKRLVIEAAHSGMWHKYAGDEGAIISVDCFGASAPGPELMRRFGMHADAIKRAAQQL